MNAPTHTKYIVGFPPVALAILALSGLFVWNWYQGNAPWPVGVIALTVCYQTFAAMAEVHRYKTWRKAWNAMGEASGSSSPSRRKKFLIPLLLIIGFAFLAQIPAISNHSNEIMVLWFLGVFGVLAFALIQKKRRHAERKNLSAPVSWLVGRPGSSPSRSDVTRILPEYSARLLSRT